MQNLLFIIISALLLIHPSTTPPMICAEDNTALECFSLSLLNVSARLLNSQIIIPNHYPIRTEAPFRLIPRVIERFPHAPQAFTQGLVLFEGEFYESTGLYGTSSLRRVTVETGEVQQQITLPFQYFAEGLALVEDRLIQLTWRENIAFIYDRLTFEQIGSFQYEGEGWGLCYDGNSLYMSNGTPIIYERDANTFEIIRTFEVIRDGRPQRNLNELACVEDTIYANIWLTDEIIQFDKYTGELIAIINAEGLLTSEEARQADVLNGIVYDPEQGLYYITGKNWPYMFLVDFVSEENGE